MNYFKLILLIILLSATSLANENKLKLNQTVDNLIQIIEKDKIKTVEEALHVISDDFFSFNNYQLFFKSYSPQPASEIYPRVILFGEKDHLRIGFNHKMGDEKDLEIMQWREDEQNWEFREIKFKNNIAHISKPNPRMCLGCHGFEKRRPMVERNNVLTSMNIFSKKIDKSKFEKVRLNDSIYSRLERLGM